jgi:hypothetical protein
MRASRINPAASAAQPSTSSSSSSDRTEPRVIGDVSGIEIRTNGVSQVAIDRVAATAHRLGRRPDVMNQLREAHAQIILIPEGVSVTDLPEFHHLAGRKTPDGRPWETVRGVTSTRDGTSISAIGEETLESTPRYTAVHEVGHLIQDVVLPKDELERLHDQFEAQKKKGFEDPYAGMSESEWFANGTAAWFQQSMIKSLNGNRWFEVNAPAGTTPLFEDIYGNASPMRSSLPPDVGGIEISASVPSSIQSALEKACRTVGARSDIEARLRMNRVTLAVADPDNGIKGLPETSGLNDMPDGVTGWNAKRLSDGRLVAFVAADTSNPDNTFHLSVWALATAVYDVGITDDERATIDDLYKQRVGVGDFARENLTARIYFADLARRWIAWDEKDAMRAQVPELAAFMERVFPGA